MTVILLDHYRFNIRAFPLEPGASSIPASGGVYAFARLGTNALSDRVWRLIYVGQARRLNKRLPTHENWPAARQQGATHVLYMLQEHKDARLRIERELIEEYQPILNLQHR